MEFGKRKDGQFYPKEGKGHGLDSNLHGHDNSEKITKKKKSKISDEEAFNDFWQEMGERGGVFDVFSGVGIDLDEALEGITTPEDIKTHYYWHIPPLEVNNKTKEKIIKHYGGIEGIYEFMAYNADWDKYKKLLEER